VHHSVHTFHGTTPLALLHHRNDSGVDQPSDRTVERCQCDVWQTLAKLLGGEVFCTQGKNDSHPDRMQQHLRLEVPHNSYCREVTRTSGADCGQPYIFIFENEEFTHPDHVRTTPTIRRQCAGVN